MSVRSDVAALIRPALPAGWLFYDHDKSVGAVGKPTAILARSRVAPGPYVGSLANTMTLVVIDPTQAEDGMDDRLDDHLDVLIPILQGIAHLEFIEAERGTYPSDNPTYPAWSISLAVTTTA